MTQRRDATRRDDAATRRDDATTQRRNDATTQRRNDATTQRRNDATTQRRNAAATYYRLADITTGPTCVAGPKLRGVKKNRHIAGGFFGEVWQGEWEGVPVAIKVAKGVEALLREVEVAMSLKLHPNLVVVYGVCNGADGELQLVLEYCEDGALLDWLRRLDKVCDTVCGPGALASGRERPSAHRPGAAC